MPLTAGSRLGPYEILAPIGAGGMGEVYRARDTRLQREVAIKVLPDATSRDSESLGLLRHFHHAQYDVACIEAFSGEEDSAIAWLTEAARNGFPCVPFFETDPWLEPLRGRERFRSLLDELRTAHSEYGRLYRELSAANP